MATDVTDAQRKAFAKLGIAMPDGSYYVRNASDLDNAVKAVGRGADDSHNAIRRHIIARAKSLKLSDKIPATWNPDGSLKHADVDAFIAHFGRKGMKWGEHIFGKGGNGSSHPVSEDAARAAALKTTVKKHGTSALSNIELQHLVTRLNLEQQHGRLNPEHVSVGQKILKETLSVGGNVAKQQASSYAQKYAAQGLDHLIKAATSS